MEERAHSLTRRLADQAEAVCRHYLSSGRRQGHYWQVGDVRNTPGRSMFVRLKDSSKGPAGKWTDAASGEHGDLLDVIREVRGLTNFADVAEEARRFLSLPHLEPELTQTGRASTLAPSGTAEAARRLFAMAQPIGGTLVETYLHNRGITALHHTASLHFHPRCYYRPSEHEPTEVWPAMIASVTDLSGHLTGAHRTWLALDGSGKAPIDTPRKAMAGPARSRGSFRPGGRGDGSRRRYRDHAVAPAGFARYGHGISSLGRTPCCHPVSRRLAQALYRSRQRSGRRQREEYIG